MTEAYCRSAGRPIGLRADSLAGRPVSRPADCSPAARSLARRIVPAAMPGRGEGWAVDAVSQSPRYFFRKLIETQSNRIKSYRENDLMQILGVPIAP